MICKAAFQPRAPVNVMLLSDAVRLCHMLLSAWQETKQSAAACHLLPDSSAACFNAGPACCDVVLMTVCAMSMTGNAWTSPLIEACLLVITHAGKPATCAILYLGSTQYECTSR